MKLSALSRQLILTSTGPMGSTASTFSSHERTLFKTQGWVH